MGFHKQKRTEKSLELVPSPFMQYKLNFKHIFSKIIFCLAKFSNEAQYTSWNIIKSIFHFYA